MNSVDFNHVKALLKRKSVAIVGSAPSCAQNEPGFVDSHDIVVRVNNYKTGQGQGFRADVHYSFYGTSIRKQADQLKSDGVKLCMCKCPNSKPIKSDWHEQNNKTLGIDFRWIYNNRQYWWFCDTFIPTDEMFMEKFVILGGHIPSTGFSAIIDVLACKPASIYLTGFDFFTSGLHNVDEPWREGNSADPIGHRPELELDYLKRVLRMHSRVPPFISIDSKLEEMMT